MPCIHGNDIAVITMNWIQLVALSVSLVSLGMSLATFFTLRRID